MHAVGNIAVLSWPAKLKSGRWAAYYQLFEIQKDGDLRPLIGGGPKPAASADRAYEIAWTLGVEAARAVLGDASLPVTRWPRMD